MAELIVHGAKERPILFSGPMVRALLDGSKTQTRRLCKPMNAWVNQECREVRMVDGQPHHFLKGAKSPLEVLRSPYGQSGDRLWVRETHSFVPDDDEPAGCSQVLYAADGNQYGKLRPSIHMPRWASRILLEVVSVRVERLQEISEPDARAEGITDGGCVNCGEPERSCNCDFPMPDYRDAYCHLWEQINGPESWHANPFVWVIEFKRVTP